MKNLSVYTTIICTILLFSCQKKENTGFDKSKLSINISKPTETQVFTKGDTVFIKASTQYISVLHGYALSISETTSKTTYFEIDEHLHESTFSIDTFWVDTLAFNTTLQLHFEVEADHNGNGASKSINFKSNL